MTIHPTRGTYTIAVLATLALAGCSSPSEEPGETVDEAEQSTADPSEGLESEAGLSTEPGLASCEFDNTTDNSSEEGPADYSGDTLQTAELRETEDAYEITLTGDLFDPDELISEQTAVTFVVELLAQEVDNTAELETSYETGEVAFSGVRTTTQDIEQDTNPELEDGAFRATYSKDVDELADFEPTEWRVRVDFDEEMTDEDNPEESVRPVSFSCGDGSPLEWQPYEGE